MPARDFKQSDDYVAAWLRENLRFKKLSNRRGNYTLILSAGQELESSLRSVVYQLTKRKILVAEERHYEGMKLVVDAVVIYGYYNYARDQRTVTIEGLTEKVLRASEVQEEVPCPTPS